MIVWAKNIDANIRIRRRDYAFVILLTLLTVSYLLYKRHSWDKQNLLGNCLDVSHFQVFQDVQADHLVLAFRQHYTFLILWYHRLENTSITGLKYYGIFYCHGVLNFFTETRSIPKTYSSLLTRAPLCSITSSSKDSTSVYNKWNMGNILSLYVSTAIK